MYKFLSQIIQICNTLKLGTRWPSVATMSKNQYPTYIGWSI